MDLAEPDESEARLKAGRSDLALTVLASHARRARDGLERRPRCSTTRCSSRCPRATRWPAGATLRLEELAEEDWMLGSHGHLPGHLDLPARPASARASSPRIAFHTDDYQAIQGFVAAGDGRLVHPRPRAGRRPRRHRHPLARPRPPDAPRRRRDARRLRSCPRPSRRCSTSWSRSAPRSRSGATRWRWPADAVAGRGLSVPLRVRYVECDMQGHVFNAHYLTSFDLAHTELLRRGRLPGLLRARGRRRRRRRGAGPLPLAGPLRRGARGRRGARAARPHVDDDEVRRRARRARAGRGMTRHVCVDAGALTPPAMARVAARPPRALRARPPRGRPARGGRRPVASPRARRRRHRGLERDRRGDGPAPGPRARPRARPRRAARGAPARAGRRARRRRAGRRRPDRRRRAGAGRARTCASATAAGSTCSSTTPAPPGGRRSPTAAGRTSAARWR